MIAISDRISYIEATDDPLSADIGIVRDGGKIWLYDVGNDERAVSGLKDSYRIVLSHFHADHTGNLERLRVEALYVSKETGAHVHAGTLVQSDLTIGGLHIFPLPSSHAKGCLGLETDEGFAFVGDGLYSRVKDGFYVYNATLLKDEIEVLRSLRAEYLLVSHFRGLIRKKADVLKELSEIYAMRSKNDPEIKVAI
ncbi:MAG: MBL fold metallo-hydrolase [Clostridia bacterium]|nr:MBL fold metallo-hydrolase [Clostridia bacterium]